MDWSYVNPPHHIPLPYATLHAGKRGSWGVLDTGIKLFLPFRYSAPKKWSGAASLPEHFYVRVRLILLLRTVPVIDSLSPFHL